LFTVGSPVRPAFLLSVRVIALSSANATYWLGSMDVIPFEAPVYIAPTLVLLGHVDTAFFCAVSADNRVAISTSRDRSARVHDLVTGTTRTVLRGHTAVTLGCSISADGTVAATASSDGSVRVWNTLSGEQLLELRRPGFERASGCALTGDGRTIVATFFRVPGYAGQIVVYDVRSSVTKSAWDRSHRVFRCTISHDASRVAFHTWNGTGEHGVEVMSTITGRAIRIWSDVARESGVSLDAYGERLVIADKRELRLFLVHDPSIHPIVFPGYSPSDWRAACITPNGERVIAPTASTGRFQFGVWDTRTGALLAGLTRDNKFDSSSHGVAVSNEGGVVLGCNGNNIYVWNIGDALGTVSASAGTSLRKSRTFSSGECNGAVSITTPQSSVPSMTTVQARQNRIVTEIGALVSRVNALEARVVDDESVILSLKVENSLSSKRVDELNATLEQLQRHISSSLHTASAGAPAPPHQYVGSNECLGRRVYKLYQRVALPRMRQALALALRTWIVAEAQPVLPSYN
jgi:WD40 repeat protein